MRLDFGVVPKFQDIARLAFEFSTDGFQGRKAYRPRPSRIQHREVLGGYAHGFGKVHQLGLAPSKHDIEIHDDRHVIEPSRSNRQRVGFLKRASDLDHPREHQHEQTDDRHGEHDSNGDKRLGDIKP